MCATASVPNFVTQLLNKESHNTFCKYIYLLTRSQACLRPPPTIYISKAHLYIKDSFSSNTLLARLQVNIVTFVVLNIQIYRKVLGIYIH